MSLSTNLISGLSSGFDWRSMIDQLMAIEHQRVDIVENRKSDYQAKLSAFQSVNTMLLSMKTQSVTLAKSDSFNVYTSSLTTTSSNYSASDFMSITTSADAAPGSHTIEMTSSSSIAQARKISSKSFSSYDEALSLTGEFIINGRAVRVDDTDSLGDIRDKINNVNSGSNATGVTASILTVSSTDYRLVLTSDNTGKDAFSILDASSVNILQNISTGLGFIDSTDPTIKNATSDGAESGRFSSSEVAVGSLLGLTSAQTGTGITVGTTNTLVIDLATESLTTIASNINVLSGVSASVKSVTEDGTTRYYIDISGTTDFTDKNNVLQTLGILVGGQSDVANVLTSDTANTLTGGGDIGTGTAFGAIDTGGGVNNVHANDTITITGTKHDGTTVSTTFDPGDLTVATLDELLTQIENDFSLGGTSGAIVNNKIQVTDNSAGDSLLSISLVANNENGGTLDLGTITASTEGYTMQTAAGKDANIKIDGTTITSSTNVITNIIAGVTINLKKIESGKQVDLNISRDLDSIKSSVQGLIDKYNEILGYINEQFAWDEDTQSAGLLSGDGTLSSIKSSLQNIVISTIKDLPTNMNALSLIGINSDMNGVLSLNDSDFTDALVSDFAGVRRIFVAEGTTTDGDISYISHARETVAGDYAVNITQAAEQAQETGNVVLTSGIGAGDIEILTITHGGKTAAVTLDGGTGENGSTIDNIVNAINSELGTEYVQNIMGNVKNTDGNATTAITSSTLWKNVWSNGSTAGLLADTGENDYTYVIDFSGTKGNGTAVSGSYTISEAGVDTVQGLLSAIEAAYGNEVSADINTYGYLVVTDNNTGNSQLDITITEPESLNFGDVTTSNLVGSQRNTTDGSTAIEATTKWQNINGSDLINNDTIKFTGYTVDGAAVEGSHQVTDIATEDVDDLLTAIENAFNAKDGASVTAEIQDGRIVVKDGTTNSTLGLTIFEPTSRTLDFGTFSGGVTGRYSIDVTASKDGSNHLVLTNDDYGSSTSFAISQSRASSNTDYKKIIYTDTANTTDASNGKIYVSSSTTWNDIYGTGTIENSDTITISGTDRNGGALNPTGVSLTYTINVANDIGDLLTRIEAVFADANNTTPTTVDARIEHGKIIIEDTTSGASQISLTLTYEDVGGSEAGNLDLGTFDQSTERDLDLGLVNGTRSGLDVAGIINNEAAAGSGQVLTGSAPAEGETTSVEGLSIKVTLTPDQLTSQGQDQGNVKITMGAAEKFDRQLYGITDPYDGYVAFKLDSLQNSIDSFETQIENMEARLDSKMEMMINRFVAMELALSKIKSQSDWLTGQINASYSGWM